MNDKVEGTASVKDEMGGWQWIAGALAKALETKSSRDIAKETGLGHATICRISNGHEPSVSSYFALVRWLKPSSAPSGEGKDARSALTPPIAGAGEEHAELIERLKAIAEGPVYGGTAAEAAASISQLYSRIGELERERDEALQRFTSAWESREFWRVAAEEENNKRNAAEAKLAEARDVLEPFATLIEASDALAAAGQRRLHPDDAKDMTDAELAALVDPDNAVKITDGRMGFGKDADLGSRKQVTTGDFRRARSFHSPKEPGAAA